MFSRKVKSPIDGISQIRLYDVKFFWMSSPLKGTPKMITQGMKNEITNRIPLMLMRLCFNVLSEARAVLSGSGRFSGSVTMSEDGSVCIV
jgi:hypothetical protein